MKTSVVGYPRIGRKRELKKAIEAYFEGEIGPERLEERARAIRLESWTSQKRAGIDHIPSNDFSLYDNVLDTAILFGLVPREYRESGLSAVDMLFAMARGRQDSSGVDIAALPMRKWFNTNYHYIVPAIEDDMVPALVGTKPVNEYLESRAAGIETRPSLVGPFTFLKLSQYRGKRRAADFSDPLADAYASLLRALRSAGASRIQFDEPCLATDLDGSDIELFTRLYGRILPSKQDLEAHLAVPFGDVRDCYREAVAMGFDGFSLDFIEGPKNLDLIRDFGFPRDATLVAGVVNGKNVWKRDIGEALDLVRRIESASGLRAEDGKLEAGTSCSLLHVPISLESERSLDPSSRSRLSFAEEKLAELVLIAKAAASARVAESVTKAFSKPAVTTDPELRSRVSRLTRDDFKRRPSRIERRAIQQRRFNLPPLPTTTIGSFPQTQEVRDIRSKLRKNVIDQAAYDAEIRDMVARCVRRQEEIGLDVLAHGEFERNDMVEFFAQRLNGFAVTENGWVQSYGTRCVKPPIVVGEVSRRCPMTVELAAYAQSLTRKSVKGMLTGPVTILNWSFPREDIPLGESALQIALAIRDEVLDLERAGIGIIQIDEAALREKTPLRKSDRSDYFDWAIAAFNLTHSGVKPETQIHTHMCYSDFADILAEIDAMDADVITFESSRSKMEILDHLAEANFETAVGPGVYDIHSPRVPPREEIERTIETMLSKLGKRRDRYDGLWVNPDCGLKTRGEAEAWASLSNLVEAANRVRCS